MYARMKKTHRLRHFPSLPQFVNFVDFLGYETIMKTKKDIPTKRCELTTEVDNKENY